MIEIRNVPNDPNDKTVIEVRDSLTNVITLIHPKSSGSFDIENGITVRVATPTEITDTPA